MSLEALAKGLRQAGGIISPDVAKQIASEDAELRGQDRQETLLRLRHTLEQEAQKASPQYQMQQEALKNERLYREKISGAGGDLSKIAAAAMEHGKTEVAVGLINQQEQRAARAQAAKDSLDLRVRDLEQRHEVNLQRITDAQQRQAEIERHNKAMETANAERTKLSAAVLQGQQELKKLEFTMKADKTLQTKVQQLGTSLEKANLPQAEAVLGEVEDAIKKSPKVAEYLSGPKSLLPDLAVGDDVKFARQAFQKLFNITLKDRSGAAVTNQELQRLKQEFATGVFKTDKQLQEAVDKARSIINSHYASVAGSFGPEVLGAYNENIRGVGGRVVLEPKKNGLAKVANDDDFDKLPSGTEFIGPDGVKRRKP
jgi:hypothetical protein